MVVHSCMLSCLVVSSAIWVARLMNSGHGSCSSSLWVAMSCCRFVSDVVLLTSSVDSSSEVLAVGGVIVCCRCRCCCCSCCCGCGCACGCCCRRRGVPMINLSIRRWVLCSCVSMSFVIVIAALPYSIVGVIVPSNSFSLDFKG